PKHYVQHAPGAANAHGYGSASDAVQRNAWWCVHGPIGAAAGISAAIDAYDHGVYALSAGSAIWSVAAAWNGYDAQQPASRARNAKHVSSIRIL
ncbi:hypothetical protein GGH20_003519, partial [Coemansia sp. RSA 1937]